MDLSQFPLEVLEVLATYLSAQDLSACSAVSYRWREAFNLDLFWRGHSDDHTVTYLESGKALVEPYFREPTYLGSMEPLCDWRVHWMRKSHVLRNWGKGRYLTQRVHFSTPIINCIVGIDKEGHHWLAVNLGDRTELWDVQTTPVFHAVFSNVTGAPNKLEIVGNKLVVVDFNYFIQVFHLNLPTLGFAPSSKFFYTDTESFFVNLADNEVRDSIRNRLRSSFTEGHVVFTMAGLLVGYCSFVESPKEPFLHVWNINTESKLLQETTLNALHYKIKTFSSAGVYVSSDLKTKRLLCLFYLYDKYISKLVLYNLKSKKFSDFNLTLSGKVDWCDISDGLVATSHLLHQIHIYSAHTGNLVHILDTNAKLVFGVDSGLQYQFLGRYMIQPSMESVKIVNLEDHWDNLLLYFYSVYKVITIPPKFVAVSARPYASSKKMILELWNIKDKIRLFDYVIADSERPAYHMVEPLLTKTVIAVGKNIKLLSFW